MWRTSVQRSCSFAQALIRTASRETSEPSILLLGARAHPNAESHGSGPWASGSRGSRGRDPDVFPHEGDTMHDGEDETRHRLVVSRGELPVEGVVEILDALTSRHSVAAVGQPLHCCSRAVVLVLDLPYHLLHDVLHRYDAHGAPVLVDD